MTWTPPFGVPAPSFGIDQPTPTTWTHIVSEATGTDLNNPYGTILHPRRTIPNVLPAGSIVVLFGAYNTAHTSPNQLVAQGTSTSPVWIVGGVGAEFKAGLEITGSYLIMEKVKGISFVVRDPASFVSLRDLEVTTWGIGVAKWGTQTISDVVICRANIHDVGDMTVTTDIDNHGVTVGAVQRLWVVDCTMNKCSGDGVQVNDPAAQDIYLGRNTSFGNRQHGLWLKYGNNIILSENDCSQHQPGVGGTGGQIGAQKNPINLYLFNNKLHDGYAGVVISSYDVGSTANVFAIGNQIYNCRGAGELTNPYAGGAAMLIHGGYGIYTQGNNIHDCDGGFQLPAGPVGFAMNQNIVHNITRASLNIEGQPSFSYSGNTFDDPTTWVIGGTPYVLHPIITNKV